MIYNIILNYKENYLFALKNLYIKIIYLLSNFLKKIHKITKSKKL